MRQSDSESHVQIVHQKADTAVSLFETTIAKVKAVLAIWFHWSFND